MTRTTSRITRARTTPRQGAAGTHQEQHTRDEIRNMLGADRWIYIAIGPNVWGKGFTQEQAIDACQGLTARKPHLMYAAVDAWARIDEMGGIVYTPRPADERPAGAREYLKVYEQPQGPSSRRAGHAAAAGQDE